MTAVLSYSGSFWIRFMVLTRKVCSSREPENPECASWYEGSFKKLTAGKLPDSAVSQKSLRSYWWLAVSRN
jgi:hypothetical protein